MPNKIIDTSNLFSPTNILDIIGDHLIKQKIQVLNERSILSYIKLITRTIITPPTSPQNGDAYLIPDSSTGDWENLKDYIAVFSQQLGGWILYSPMKELKVHILDENIDMEYDGIEWVVGDSQDLNNYIQENKTVYITDGKQEILYGYIKVDGTLCIRDNSQLVVL